MPPIFQPHRGEDPKAQIRHIENALTAMSQALNRLNAPGLAAKNTGNAAAGAAASGSGSGGGSGVLAGDVTGPAAADTVALLQGVTLTLTSPVTGQVLTFNGTAIVNSSTITGDLTITGVTTTGGFRTAVTAKSGNYTLVYTDEFVAADATGGPFTLTLPTAVGHAGQQFEAKKVDASVNAVTVATTGGQTIDGAATAGINLPESSLTFRSDGANWKVV